MSTVLEAVRVRDGLVPPVSLDDAVDGPRRPWTRPAVVLACALVAAIPAAVLLPMPRGRWHAGHASPASPVASVEPVAPLREAVAAPPVPAAPGRERPVPAMGEPPRARVGRWDPILQPAAVSVPGAVAVSAAPPAGPAAAAASSASRAVRLESVHYGESLGARTVTLAVDGAAPVSLRQGESVGDVEVQLVLPGGAYVRRGADIFAVGDVR